MNYTYYRVVPDRVTGTFIYRVNNINKETHFTTNIDKFKAWSKTHVVIDDHPDVFDKLNEIELILYGLLE